MNTALKIINEKKDEYKGLSGLILARKIHADLPHLFSSPDQIRDILRGKTSRENVSKSIEAMQGQFPAVSVKQNKPCLNEKQLREMYDINSIVRKALKSISPNEFWPDAEFVRFFGLQGKAGYRAALESAEALPHKGKAQGKVLWGHPSSIQQMKNEGVLL